MRVKLLHPHIIADVLHETDEELDVSIVTPFMLGLDPAARDAIKAEKIRVFGRYVGQPRFGILLDDPPIERPIGENQPVPRFGRRV